MAGVAASTASGHLHKLIAGSLLRVVEQGRHRYYMLADDHVAHLLEILSVGREAPRSMRHANSDAAIATARTCYDHLAGRLGVAPFQALRESESLALSEDAVRLSDKGISQLRCMGLLEANTEDPDLPGRTCVDWTERRVHLGGPLGAWLAERVFAKQWLRRRTTTRAITPTEAARVGLSALGMRWDGLA